MLGCSNLMLMIKSPLLLYAFHHSQIKLFVFLKNGTTNHFHGTNPKSAKIWVRHQKICILTTLNSDKQPFLIQLFSFAKICIIYVLSPFSKLYVGKACLSKI
jgi:hypothetical protein